VKHFIQLPFGDNYCVEPEEPKAAVVAAHGTPGNKTGLASASLEEAVLSGNTVSNGGVASVSTSGAACADADTVTDAHDLVSPFTDSSHPLFAQVRT